MLIVVKSCKAHSDRELAQFETWGHVDKVWFADGEILGVPDDYDSLPQKTKAICNSCRNEDFVFLTDTDTYVHVERLMSSGYENYDYSGFVRDDGFLPQYCYGPGYWLSNRSLNILADADWSQYPSIYPTCEDAMVGNILHAHGILPHHDPRYALYHDVLPDNDIISSHLSNAGKKFEIEFMYEAHRKANGS